MKYHRIFPITLTSGLLVPVIWFLTLINIHAQHAVSQLRFRPVDLPQEIPHIDHLYEDSRGLLWIGTYGGLYLYDGYQLEHFAHIPGDTNSLGDNKIRCLLDLGDGNLWVGTQNGLHFLNTRTRTFKDYRAESGITMGMNSLRRENLHTFYACTNGGIFRGQMDTNDINHPKFEKISGEHCYQLTINDGGDLWIYGQKKSSLKPSGQPLRTIDISALPGVHGERITMLFFDDLGKLWINTEMGVHQYDMNNRKVVLYYPWPVNAFSTFQNHLIQLNTSRFFYGSGDAFYEIDLHAPGLKQVITDQIFTHPGGRTSIGETEVYLSKSDNIWLSYHEFSLARAKISNHGIYSVATDFFRNFNNPGYYHELYEFYPGKLFLCHENGNFLFDYRNGQISKFNWKLPYRDPAINCRVTCFFETKAGLLWLGSGRGIFLYDKHTEAFLDLKQYLPDIEIPEQTLARDIFEDSHQNLWVAGWGNKLFRIDLKEKKLSEYSSTLTKVDAFAGFRVIYEDRDRNIWIGARSGLHRYLPAIDSFIVYRHDDNDPESMSENTSFCIYQDTLGFIWSGSYGGGLNRLDTATGKFRHFTVKDGLLNNNIFSLIPDEVGNLWIVSYDGITRFNPYTFQTLNITHHHGLGSEKYDAFLYGKSNYTGEIFALGNQSLDIFHPDSIRLSDFKPPIFFTGFQIFNEEVPIRLTREMSPDIFYLDQHISWTKDLIIPYNKKVFTIDYAAIDYNGPENIRYAYQMEGFDADWQMVNSKRSATYTNLDPGHYTFKVKSTNADRVWNEEYTSLSILITPPWWATRWAYGFYLLMTAGILYGIYYYQKRRWALQTALQLQKQEASRLKELDQLKSNLYTNITHEFRTPLTVISGMTDLIQEKPREWLQHGITLIRDHNQRLLQMVNQMLDLQKMESGKMELSLLQSDIMSFLRSQVEPFQFLAIQKNLSFQLDLEPPVLQMDFDSEKLSQVISNLLSNAIKFTSRGSVEVGSRDLADGWFAWWVSDTGRGIPADKLPLIFDRFYQVEQGNTRQGEGTGIGLALVKQLVELMGGQIKVESEPGLGSTFTVVLPVSQAAPTSRDLPVVSPGIHLPVVVPIEENLGSGNGLAERILIIEDQVDVRRYLRAMLQDQFMIHEAADGREGVEKTIQLVPDLVICDVMMPRMDGYAVIGELHRHPLTNHIPVIMLTAKADMPSRIEGIKRGAEVYLTKPFHSGELLAQVRMLLEQRKRLQEKFRLSSSSTAMDQQPEVLDPFISEVEKLILTELDNPELRITQICKKMLVSRTQLHHKIKSVTGYSTSIFIRRIRLNEARRLLASTRLSVAEIAYQTGFNDPNFFSRVYKKEFGERPGEGR